MLHKQFTKSNVKSVKLISHMILIKYGELTQCLCKGGRDGQEGGPWLVSTVGCFVKCFQEYSSLRSFVKRIRWRHLVANIP